MAETKTKTPAQQEREKRQQQREARESQEEQTRQDEQGNEIDMSANIPEEQEGWEDKELDQTAKHNDLGEGHHKNSKTFGVVISDYAPDAAGLTPEENHQRAERRMGHEEEETKEKEERAEASVQQMEENKEERQKEADKKDDKQSRTKK